MGMAAVYACLAFLIRLPSFGTDTVAKGMVILVQREEVTCDCSFQVAPLLEKCCSKMANIPRSIRICNGMSTPVRLALLRYLAGQVNWAAGKGVAEPS